MAAVLLLEMIIVAAVFFEFRLLDSAKAAFEGVGLRSFHGRSPRERKRGELAEEVFKAPYLETCP